MSDEHLAGRGLALGVVGGAMHGPAAVGGGVSNQEQLNRADEQRHPLDERLVALSKQLAFGHVPATAAELVMEARDEIARMHGAVAVEWLNGYHDALHGEKPWARPAPADGDEGGGEPACDCGKVEHGRHHSACPVEVHKRRLRAGDVIKGVGPTGSAVVLDARDVDTSIGVVLDQEPDDLRSSSVDRAGMPPVIAEQASGLGDNDSWVGPDGQVACGDLMPVLREQPSIHLPLFDRALARFVIELIKVVSVQGVLAKVPGDEVKEEQIGADDAK